MDYGTVTLSGETEVWSDQINWTLTASASDLNSTSVSFALSDDGSGLEIDSTTGVIQGAATPPGVYELTIDASDSAGGSTSATFNFTSNAFVAGHWTLERTESNENLMLVVSRNGLVSLITRSASGVMNAVCHGQADIVGDRFTAELACSQRSADGSSTSDNSVVVSGTVVEGSRITLAGLDTGQDSVFVFQTAAEVFNFGTITPGIYVEYSDYNSGISLVEVNAEGELTALAPEDVGFQSKSSRCELSGNLNADPVFADYEIDDLKEALQVFETTVSLTNCDLDGDSIRRRDYNQNDTLAHGASVMDTLAASLSFNLYLAGNPDSNDGYNAGYFHYVHFCDESNQLTAVADFLADTEPFSIVVCPSET